MSLVTRLRLRARDKALAASRRLSTGQEWERHVREEFALLALRPGDRNTVADEFHRRYYDAGYAGGTWADTRWFGVATLKCPLDLWIYQELVHELAPDLIVETGTADGGSGLFLATLCEANGRGEVISVDVEAHPGRPRHDRLVYVTGSSTDPAVVEQLARRARDAETVLVLLDSDHSRDHVLAELRAYAPLVTPGSYLVVEDTNVNGHPVYEHHGPGPMEAVQDFLKENDAFAADASREKLLLTFNPGGWLRKLR
ncbi:MAG TPA: CmcI family methyltransferase [Actinomycetes bacterium]|nr:CmcI family methyltransferase [Actinomycetes bacterium]